MKRLTKRTILVAVTGVAAVLLASCSSDSPSTTAESEAAAVETTAASDAAAAGAPGSEITLAVNPWTGSAVNAQVAKVVLESKLGTPVKLIELDENATWAGLDAGDIDAVLEVWPSGHTKDYDTYITGKKSVVDLGKLGPQAKISWYVTAKTAEENPSLTSWEGFKDAATSKKFATAESGDLGQFLMGDPSYVSYDEQIIANLKLPLKYTVAGSEAALITAITNADKDGTPLLVQFWQPHWMHSKVKLTPVSLPAVSSECAASAAAKDGKYACDYPVDDLYKAASAKLAKKNPAAQAFLSKFQLTTQQQNEIASQVDSEKIAADVAAKAWVEANAGVVDAWLK